MRQAIVLALVAARRSRPPAPRRCGAEEWHSAAARRPRSASRPRSAKSATSSSGARQPRPADHRRQRRHRRPASSPTTAAAGTATRPSAAAAKGGSPGPGRTSSGRSPTSRPARQTGTAAALAHLALPLRERPGRRLLRRAARRAELLPADETRPPAPAPSDCWFGGERLPGTAENVGAFHLHWDGAAITAIPSLTIFSPSCRDPGRSVSGLAYHQGSFYESVDVEQGDVPASKKKPPKKRASAPRSCTGSNPAPPRPFKPLFGSEPFDYGEASAEASELQGFRLSGDDGEPLWAVAGAEGSGSAAALTALRLEPAGLGAAAARRPGRNPRTGRRGRRRRRRAGQRRRLGRLQSQVADALRELSGPSRPGPRRRHASTPQRRCCRRGRSRRRSDRPQGPRRAGRLHGGRAVLDGDRKAAGCSTSAPIPSRTADPAMHVLVTFRPKDDSLPIAAADRTARRRLRRQRRRRQLRPGRTAEASSKRCRTGRRRWYAKIKQQLVDGTVLEMSFTLRAKAHVRLARQPQGPGRRRHQAPTRWTRGRRSLRLQARSRSAGRPSSTCRSHAVEAEGLEMSAVERNRGDAGRLHRAVRGADDLPSAGSEPPAPAPPRAANSSSRPRSMRRP